MAQQVLEGTWEEVSRHADELAGKWVKLTVLADEPRAEAVLPNEGMLAALREIAKLQEGMRETSGEDTQRLLREARAGGMYGYEPSE